MKLNSIRLRISIAVFEDLQSLVLSTGDEVLVAVDREDWALMDFDRFRAAGSLADVESTIRATTD